MRRHRLLRQHSPAGALLAAAGILAGCGDATPLASPIAAPGIVPAFAIVPQAEPGYLAETVKIDISALADLSVHGSISDGTQTVTFSQFVEKRSIPGSGGSVWGEPPYVESATPAILVPLATTTSLVMNLSVPSPVFGVELRANLNGTFRFTALFLAGNTLLESVTQDIPGQEARLFAASAQEPISRVIIIDENTPAAGFAIAQVRYGVAADLQVTIDGRGEVDPSTGESLVTGTIRCARPVSVGLEVTLAQNQKSRRVPPTLTVTEGLAISCSTPGFVFPWSVAMTPASGEAFQNGPASAHVHSTTPLLTPVAVDAAVKLGWAHQ